MFSSTRGTAALLSLRTSAHLIPERRARRPSMGIEILDHGPLVFLIGSMVNHTSTSIFLLTII